MRSSTLSRPSSGLATRSSAFGRRSACPRASAYVSAWGRSPSTARGPEATTAASGPALGARPAFCGSPSGSSSPRRLTSGVSLSGACCIPSGCSATCRPRACPKRAVAAVAFHPKGWAGHQIAAVQGSRSRAPAGAARSALRIPQEVCSLHLSLHTSLIGSTRLTRSSRCSRGLSLCTTIPTRPSKSSLPPRHWEVRRWDQRRYPATCPSLRSSPLRSTTSMRRWSVRRAWHRQQQTLPEVVPSLATRTAARSSALPARARPGRPGRRRFSAPPRAACCARAQAQWRRTCPSCMHRWGRRSRAAPGSSGTTRCPTSTTFRLSPGW
mmetsp:Transcript_74571/g.230472  ORF Transcript_74571/g.230472 Transcript_74571/m.230472 type:complete len:325 (+) Transcript_74571:1823-2797(+)